jgi:hypothetical protein
VRILGRIRHNQIFTYYGRQIYRYRYLPSNYLTSLKCRTLPVPLEFTRNFTVNCPADPFILFLKKVRIRIGPSCIIIITFTECSDPGPDPTLPYFWNWQEPFYEEFYCELPYGSIHFVSQNSTDPHRTFLHNHNHFYRVSGSWAGSDITIFLKLFVSHSSTDPSLFLFQIFSDGQTFTECWSVSIFITCFFSDSITLTECSDPPFCTLSVE